MRFSFQKIFIFLISFLLLAFIFSLLPFFIKEVQAAGYGWTMPIGLSGGYGGCLGKPDGNRLSRVTFQIRNSENHNQSLTGNIKVINRNDGSITKKNNVSSLTIDCIDPYDGFYLKVTGVSNFYDFDGGAIYFPPRNFTNSYITNRIFMVPNGKPSSVNMSQPPNQSWLKKDPTFQLNFRLAPGIGSSYVQKIYFYLYNFTTGSFVCQGQDSCLGQNWKGNFSPGTHTFGPFSLPDGWYGAGFFTNDNRVTYGISTFPASAWSGPSFTDGIVFDQNFGIDRKAPNIWGSHSPINPLTTQKVTLKGEAKDPTPGSGVKTIWIYLNNTTNLKKTCDNLNVQVGQKVSCSVDVGKLSAGTYKYYIKAKDLAGNETGFLEKSFTVTATSNNTLNVKSSPATGIWIHGSQSGTGGTTNYTVTKSTDINTTLTAPTQVTIGGTTYNFSSWLGCDSVSGRNCTAVVTGGRTQTVTANYTAAVPINTLNVSSSPVTGISITGSQSGTGGTTNYTVTKSTDINTTLTALASVVIGGTTYNFDSWSGCDSVVPGKPKECEVEVTGGGTKTVTANYFEPLPIWREIPPF